MEVKTHIELPEKHLLNLAPRPQQQTQYQAYRADYNYSAAPCTDEPVQRHSHQVPLDASPRTSTEITFQKNVTKLPVPSSISDRARDQRNNTPSPTGIPKPLSSATLSSTTTNTPSPGSERDQYWKKLRDRYEKGSPLSHRSSYHRTRATDKKLSSVQPDDAPMNDELSSRGASPRSTIPSPKSTIPSPSITKISRGTPNILRAPSPQLDRNTRWSKKNGGWVSLESQDGLPSRSDSAGARSESSPHSRCPSVSPISDVSSVTDCDWEDRFVVHMPSAKDPNPPTMTTEEIADYQSNLSSDKIRRHDKLRRSPLTTHAKRLPPGEMQDKSEGPENIGGYDGSYAQSQQIPERPQLSTTSPLEAQHDGNYYSPDEIGKNRISTIWEESPTRSSKEKRVSHNPDGSFLGCKEINGPAPTNPDDVLLFASGEDSTTLQPRPLAIGAKKRLKEKASRAPRKSEEKTGSPDEGQRTSQSLNHPLCSRQSSATMCQDFAPQREAQSPESQSSSKENCRPETSMDIQIEHPLPDGVNEDDVFIITPTITRTLIPTPGSANLPKPEKKGFTFKPQGLRRPGGTGYSGTGEAVKAIRAKAQVISTPSMLQPATGLAQKKSTAPSLASSSLPVPKDTDAKGTATLEKEKPGKPKESTKVKESLTRNGNSASSSIRGFIRTTGLAKSTSTGKSPTGSLATILRNGTESLRNRAENLRNGTGSFTSRKGSPVSLPTRDNSESSRSERSFKSAKETATDASPSSTKTSSTKKANLTSKLSIGKESPTEKATPADTTEEQTPIAKPLNVDKDKENPVGPDPLPVEKGDSSPKSEKLSRSERLEKFKEQARLRRAAANAAKAKISDKPVEIAELDGEQVPGLKETLQPNITDVEELRDINAKDKDDIASSEAPNAVVLSLFFQTVFLFVTKIHRLTLQIPNNPYLKFGINNVLSMSTHCYDVFNCIYRAISVYQATGTWPRPRNDQAISRFMVEVLQACVYLVILGFGVLVIGRAVRYLLLFGSWLLWFATPVVWVFRGLTRALIS